MQAGGMMREIRLLIHDRDKFGYSDALLLEFINDGLCFIYQLQPESFSVSVLLPAVAGEVQCLGDCGGRIISVDGVTDACGNPLAPVRQGSVKMARAFNKTISGKQAYTFSIRDHLARAFEIHPPVQAQESVYFRITCSRAPEPLQSSSDTLPDCRFHEALLNYVLYRVYSVESDSGSSQALANRYYGQLLQLLNAQNRAGHQLSEDNHAAAG